MGGTFTDLVGWDGEQLRTAKVTTTPDQSDGVIDGSSQLGGESTELLHGTTVATNALLERKGAVTALVTDPGFADVIEIGRQDRPALYDPFVDRPEPLFHVDCGWRHPRREIPPQSRRSSNGSPPRAPRRWR